MSSKVWISYLSENMSRRIDDTRPISSSNSDFPSSSVGCPCLSLSHPLSFRVIFIAVRIRDPRVSVFFLPRSLSSFTQRKLKGNNQNPNPSHQFQTVLIRRYAFIFISNPTIVGTRASFSNHISNGRGRSSKEHRDLLRS